MLLAQAVTAQWSQWRGAERTGVSNETSLQKEWPAYGPKLAWSTDTVGQGFSSAIVHNNVIYTTGKKDSVEIMTAFSLDGKMLWQTPFGRASFQEWPESRSTPTIYDGKAYAMTVVGDVACVDIKTGKINWKTNSYEKYEGISAYNGHGESLLVNDDKVIITPAGNKTTMVALNRLTGKTIWETESLKDTNYYTSPVLIEKDGNKKIISSTLNNFFVVDFKTGKILHQRKGMIGIIPIIENNQIYFSNRGGSIKLSLNDYSELWKDSVLRNYSNGVVKVGNRLFGTCQWQNTGLVCLDWETGKTLSTNKEIRSGSIIAADNMLYCYEEQRGRVCLIKMNKDNTTELVCSFIVKTGRGPHLAHLSIANGYLLIRHGKFLLAYDIRQSA